MSETFYSHLGLWASIVIPLGSGIGLLIYRQGQMALKVDTLWQWFTNDAHELTGYQPGDERKRR